MNESSTMSDDAAFLQTILQQTTETNTLEFKRLGTSKNDMIDRTLESIVAFANTYGGMIVFGVDDPEKSTLKGMNRVFGVEENIGLFDALAHEIKNITPPIPNLWNPLFVDVPEKGVRVAVLQIPKVTDQFRSIKQHVHVRLEKGNRRLTPQEVVTFSYAKGFEHADRDLVDVPFNLLDTHYYDLWRKKRGIEEADVAIVLEKTGLARRSKSNKLLPTRAAVLLFAEFPNDLLDTKCVIRVFQYEGTLQTIKETLNLIGTPQSITGPLVKQISNAHSYVLTLLRAGMRVPSGFVTQYQLPERAIKEAITNAVIHRDYYLKRDIEVRIFEDRVEVESPGLFPFNITPNNIGKVRAQGYRNDLLVKHLREFPDPPNLDQNEGIKAMRSVMISANLYPPIFFTYPNLQDAVRVVLFNEKTPNEWDKVSYHLQQHGTINNAQARKLLGIDDTIRVSRLFNQWTKKGVVVKVASHPESKRNVSYKLPVNQTDSLFAKEQSK